MQKNKKVPVNTQTLYKLETIAAHLQRMKLYDMIIAQVCIKHKYFLYRMKRLNVAFLFLLCYNNDTTQSKRQLGSERAFRISIFGLSKICVVTNGDTDAGVSSFEDTPLLINPSVFPFGNTARRRTLPMTYPTHRK